MENTNYTLNLHYQFITYLRRCSRIFPVRTPLVKDLPLGNQHTEHVQCHYQISPLGDTGNVRCQWEILGNHMGMAWRPSLQIP